MEESRRRFLRRMGYATAGAVGFFPLLRALGSGGREAAAGTKQMGMVVDVRKCLDEKVRRACIDACHREHNVPTVPNPLEEVKWLWSEKYEVVFPDHAHSRVPLKHKGKPVLIMCNHCTSPGCVKICPTKATFKRKSDGIVVMDMHRCLGCRFCIAACPYGARSFNFRDPRPILEKNGTHRKEYPTRVRGSVEKCNFCAERVRLGQEPACVEAAKRVSGGAGALNFGDLSDPNSEISVILREKHTLARRVGLGFGPNVFYIV
ncbi:MAG: sulfate reduction electron transfer complex DsrMKJOP subunit DsrO [Planctomycetota bacterium]|jgi:molybdopterin-containing oxidoreductase family iron-sulfur binding subunit